MEGRGGEGLTESACRDLIQPNPVFTALTPFEAHVVAHLRTLRRHGWGHLHIVFDRGHAVSCVPSLADDPAMLRAIQEED